MSTTRKKRRWSSTARVERVQGTRRLRRLRISTSFETRRDGDEATIVVDLPVPVAAAARTGVANRALIRAQSAVKNAAITIHQKSLARGKASCLLLPDGSARGGYTWSDRYLRSRETTCNLVG